jgi:hypothetical protein
LQERRLAPARHDEIAAEITSHLLEDGALRAEVEEIWI